MSDPWYCPDGTVSIEWIEKCALRRIDDFQDVDSVYMSEDIYEQFANTMAASMRGPYPVGHQGSSGMIIQIVTSAGTLTVKVIPHFTNFCHVGTSMTYDELVRVQIDQQFEDIVLKDCEREL